MKIHTLQIPPEGKHLEGEDPASIFELPEPDCQPVTPVAYSLDVGISNGGIFATGNLSTRFRLRCVRCLEPFEMPIQCAEFACQKTLTNSETVDLTEEIREDILLALPAHPSCERDGGQVCASLSFEKLSGTSTPQVSDGNVGSEGDEPPKRDIWSVLDQLKDRVPDPDGNQG
jgi:uncharacterized protein